MPNQEKFSIRSQEVQELIDKPPRWIIRWGLTVICFLIGLIIVSSIVVKVPEYVSVACAIEIIGDSNFVKANKQGQITALGQFEQIVHKDDNLLSINSVPLPAPKDGYVLLYEPLYQDKTVAKNDTLFLLVNKESQFLVNLQIPKRHYRQVEAGQLISLENNELFFTAELLSVSNLADKEYYKGVAIIDAAAIIQNAKTINTVLNTNEAKVLVSEKSLFAGLL